MAISGDGVGMEAGGVMSSLPVGPPVAVAIDGVEVEGAEAAEKVAQG